MCIAEVIAVTKDAILAIGTVVGSYVALRGLNTWNRQLKGGVEYDLTRRLLRCTYKLRDAMNGVRYPVMFNNEMASPPEEDGKGMSAEERRYYGTSQTYQRRWDKVSEVRNELQTELLEGEVLWEKIIHEKFEPLFALQRELFSDVRSYLMACNPSEQEESRRAMSEIRRKRREVLYSGLGEEPDLFSADVEKAITGIETFLKPYLRK